MNEMPTEHRSDNPIQKTPDGAAPFDARFGDLARKGSRADFEPTRFVARTLFEHAPIPMLMVDQAGTIQHINQATEQLFGYSRNSLVGEPVEVLLPADARLRHQQLRHDFMQHPISRSMAEGRLLTGLTREGVEVPVEIALNPVVMDTSEVAVVLSVIDSSARQRAERAEFFVKELNHRARNMFAIVGAISRQIARYSTSVSDFQAAFESRLNALATSYRVFEKEKWQAAQIDDLVRYHLSFVVKQGSSQIDIDGPELRLQPSPAEYLGLAIHELATNAVKHGALSTASGAVNIRWVVDVDTGTFTFHWKEHDGPPVAPSGRQGFGSAILKSIVPAACGGTANLSLSPTGVSWELSAPVTILMSTE